MTIPKTLEQLARLRKEHSKLVEPQATDRRAALAQADQVIDSPAKPSNNLDRAQVAQLGTIDQKRILDAQIAYGKQIADEIRREIATEEDLKHCLALFPLPDIAEALFRTHGAIGTLSAIITGANKIADDFTLETRTETNATLQGRSLDKANRYRCLALGLDIVLEKYQTAKTGVRE